MKNAFITPCAKNSRSAVNAFTHALANIYLFKCKQQRRQNDVTPCPSVFIVDFEQVNNFWSCSSGFITDSWYLPTGKEMYLTWHKNESFPLTISSVNVTKSAISWKASFFMQCQPLLSYTCRIAEYIITTRKKFRS